MRYSQVNSMIQAMTMENNSLKAGLKETAIKTQQQTKQLEERYEEDTLLFSGMIGEYKADLY